MVMYLQLGSRLLSLSMLCSSCCSFTDETAAQGTHCHSVHELERSKLDGEHGTNLSTSSPPAVVPTSNQQMAAVARTRAHSVLSLSLSVCLSVSFYLSLSHTREITHARTNVHSLCLSLDLPVDSVSFALTFNMVVCTCVVPQTSQYLR